MIIRDVVYDNWGNSTEINRYYDELPVIYRLTTSSGTIDIKEPIDWGQVKFVHKRDKDMHGFNYEFTGADFDLKFDLEAGGAEIQDEYDTFGNDGEVLFYRILVYGSEEIVEYEGRLNLSTLKDDRDMLSCSVERKSLHQLINSRIGTKIEINSDKTLDDVMVPTYSEDFLILPGQTLSEKFESSNNVTREEPYSSGRTGINTAYLFFDFKDPKVNTMAGFVESQLGVSDVQDAITGGNHNLFEFTADGSYTFNVAVDFLLGIRIHPRFLAGGKKVTNAGMFTQIIKMSGTGESMVSTKYDIHTVPDFNPNLQGFEYPRVTASLTQLIDVVAGDRIAIAASFYFGHNANKLKSISFKAKQYKVSLKINGQSSSADPSLTGGRLIKNAMDALFLRMTGETNVVKSNFYSLASETQPVDGCGANRIIMNGGAIRKTNIFPLTFTLKDMLTSLNAIDCIGMGYEWDSVDQKEIIRIEPAEYFYRDVEVIELPSVYDYKQETAKDLIFNKITVGYDKYKEEDENSLDEIHANHEYQTPIKTESNEYPIKSKFNASGYLIETTRRAYFLNDPNISTSYDDDIFIIHVSRPSTDLSLWEPVTNEPFDNVSGCLSPETTVNMTLSPKRMLMAHSKWLMSSLIYKNGSQLVKNTFTKQNKDFSTTLKSDYCKRGDEQNLPLKASDDILLAAFGDFTGIYSPEWINLKTRLAMRQVRYIINAHRGLSPDGNNYGYLTFKNKKGTITKGWLHELAYNRINEEVTLRLLKKKFPS